MNAFVIEGEDRPGHLHQLAEALAERGINITNIGLVTSGGRGYAALITNDESGTRTVLADQGMTIREVELVAATLEDRPGTLAELTKRLAGAGVNIELILPAGMRDGKVTIALGTSDPAKTREVAGTGAMASA